MKPGIEGILQRHLQALMKTKNVQHAVMAVERLDGSFKWSGAEGIAKPDGTPMKTDTPYCIASVTKLFIATGILKLQEQGKLSIDHAMSNYLPAALIHGLHGSGARDHTAKITLRHLLEHSSGLPDYLEIRSKDQLSLFDAVIESGDQAWTLQDFAEILRTAKSSHFEPQPVEAIRKKVRYSDTNYQLLMQVMVEVTGRSVQETLSELIFEPLGLHQTFHPRALPDEARQEAAVLWYKDKALNIPEALASFGDLYSTSEDLVSFMRGLVSGKIFKTSGTFDFMCQHWHPFGFSLSPIGPGWPIEYGLGIMRFRYPRFMTPWKPLPEVIGHTGVTGAWLFYCPALELILTGDVSQVTASPLPFQAVPRLLKDLI